MSYGSLRIKMPDGREQEFNLNQPQIRLGRAPDNDITIEHITISRYHARINVAAGQLVVEDLGSTNGTYLARHRLDPNRPVPASVDQAIRLGDVELRYNLPSAEEITPAPPGAAQDQEQWDTAETIAPSRAGATPANLVTISLTDSSPQVEPGSTVSLLVILQNNSNSHQDLVLRLSGLPGGWSRLSSESLQLAPGSRQEIVVYLHPPRHPETIAREHPFTVSVYPPGQGQGVSVHGTLTVSPFFDFSMVVEPLIGTGDFQILADNKSNIPLSYQFSGTDLEGGFAFEFAQPTLNLAPGQSASLSVLVTPRARPFVGVSEPRTFTILAMPTSPGGKEARADAQIILRPLVPIWLIPVLLFLFLCACLTSAYAYVQVCQRVPANLPFCPADGSPVIDTFDANPPEVAPGETVVISWEVRDAEQVELTAPALELHVEVEPQGSQNFTLAQSTTFTLRAMNPAGSVEQDLVVLVIGSPPLIQHFTAEPGAIVPAQVQEITLDWSVVGADAVRIEGLADQDLPPVGSINIPAPEGDTTYTLVASNEAGETRQAITVFVISHGCVISNIAPDQRLDVYEGPGPNYPVVAQLDGGTPVEPLARTAAADWLRVRAFDREGWIPTNFVTCVVAFQVFPTVDPAQIPPEPTETPVPTEEPTLAPTPPEVPTATPPAIITSEGVITYRVQTAEGTSILFQATQGAAVPLVANKTDAEVLDYSPHDGGRFAIWVVEGGSQFVYIVLPTGQQVGSPLNQGWESVVDASWSLNGQRLVVEAVTAGSPAYYYFTSDGQFTGQPDFP